MQTKSLFFKGNPVKSFDENEKPCQGARIYSGNVILRFKDGYLDGDTVIDGTTIVQPAVEAGGVVGFGGADEEAGDFVAWGSCFQTGYGLSPSMATGLMTSFHPVSCVAR